MKSLLTRKVSRDHGLFTWSRKLKRYIYQDTSRFGTTINRKLFHGTKKTLEDKDKINVQGIRFQLLYA